MLQSRMVSVCLLVLAGAVMLGGCKPDKTPPGNPTGFAATLGDTQVALAWTNPTDLDLASVRVKRSAAAYPATQEDGDTVYEGLAGACTDTGLQNGTPYFYTAFAVDQKGNWSSGVQATATPNYTPVLTGDFTGIGEEVIGAGVFDDGQIRDILDALQEANGLLDGGDPCGAGAKMRELADLLQTLRAGEAMQACEQLYAEVRMLRRTIAVSLPEKDQCVEFERVDARSVVLPEPLETDLDKLTADAVFGEPTLLALSEGEEMFTKADLPGLGPDPGAPGLPQIPATRSLFAVPEGATVAVEYSPEVAETIKMNLWPGQPDVKDAVDPFYKPPFTQNTAAYQSNAPFPAEPATIRDLGKMRGVRMFQLDVAGGQYLPSEQQLTLFKKVNIKLNFQGGTQYGTGQTFGPLEEPGSGLYGVAINWDLIKEKIVPQPLVVKGIGEELMILTHPDFLDEANRLAGWKNQIGVMSAVFVVNDGDGSGPDTAAEIDALVESEYANASPRPAYVLLLGDAEFIPPAYLDGLAAPVDLGSDFIGTDRPLELIGGDPNNNLLTDLAVGRLPIDTVDEAHRVVDRIIAYEGAPPNDANFYSRAAIASQFQCCNTETATAGVDQRTFIWVSEFARNLMNSHGKTVDRLYAETVDGAYTKSSTPKYYYDGASLPADLKNGFAWNGSTQKIVDAFNQGRFVVIHRDHGSPGGWETPWFTWRNIYGGPEGAPSINNAPLLPLVFSVNCASGLFDDETAVDVMGTTSDFDLLMERLIRDTDGGAIGVIGDVRNSPSTANSLLLRGFLDAMWPDALPAFGTSNMAYPRLGDMLRHGKAYLVSQMGLWDYVNFMDVHDEILMWHCFGDPTLAVWTVNPNTQALPPPTSMSWVNGKVHVVYPTNGVIVSAQQRSALGGLVSYGRGTVVNGAANLTMHGTVTAPLDTHVSFAMQNAVTVWATLPETQPPANVTNFTAVAHKTTIMLNWKNPTSDFLSVRIMRKTGSYPTSPLDGTMVTTGGNGTSYYDGGLAVGTPYFYTAFSYDEHNNISSGALATATTWSDITAPPDVTGFAAVADNAMVHLSWTNPESPDLAAVVVIRKVGGGPFSETDGTAVYTGLGSQFLDMGVVNGTTYYYRAYTRDVMPNYSTGVLVPNITPAANSTTPPSPPPTCTAKPGPGTITLNWSAPPETDFASVLIRWSTSAFPATPAGGQGGRSCNAGVYTTVFTKLGPGIPLYFTVFSRDTQGNYSATGRQATAAALEIIDITPPGEVTEFTAENSVVASGVDLSWTNPADADFMAVRIQRSEETWPTQPTEAVNVYDGAGTYHLDATVAVGSGKTYYYTCFTRDNAANYSTGAQAQVTVFMSK